MHKVRQATVKPSKPRRYYAHQPPNLIPVAAQGRRAVGGCLPTNLISLHGMNIGNGRPTKMIGKSIENLEK